MLQERAQERVRLQPRRWTLTRTEWLLFSLVLVSVGLLVHPYKAQQASRYALTAAVVERNTVVLDDYAGVLGRDHAVRDGHIYSDKAPGQPILAVPFYAIGRWAGVEDATVLRVEDNLGLWWITLWSAALPGAALAVMMYRRARAQVGDGTLFGSLVALAGTVLLPLSSLLFGHVLAACLLYGSFLLLDSEEGRVGGLVASGVLAGLAVTVEYTVAFGVVVLAAYGLWRHRSRFLAWIGGGAVPAVGLALYNVVAFGGPLTLSYQFSAFSEVTDTGRPVFTMFSSATLHNTIRLLFEGRGLLIATPIVVVAIAGAISRLRRGFQIDAVIALAMFAAFAWIPVFWANPWGGDSVGPRYLTPALAFLALPIVWARKRWPKLTLFASGLSVMTMVVATYTNPMIPRDSTNGLNIWLQKLAAGDVVTTVPVLLMGNLGWLVQLAAVTVIGVLLHRSNARDLSHGIPA